MLLVLRPDAAGIDIGAEEMFVPVPPDRDADSVRSFGTFTRDLHELCALAPKVRDSHGGDGVNRGLLDSNFSAPRDPRRRSIPGECKSREKRSGA
jgi:hypothetical protein